MPVSLREESNKDLNNQASMVLAELGYQSWRRGRALAGHPSPPPARSRNRSKPEERAADGLSRPAGAAAGIPPQRRRGQHQADGRMPPVANVVISNVPGPQVPLYLAGAQMKTFFRCRSCVHGMALNITVQTYCGRIDFGLVACRAMPDLNDLGTAIEGRFLMSWLRWRRCAEIDRERAEDAARSGAADAAAALEGVKKPAAAKPGAAPCVR